jgi:hypothetical protein
MDMRVSQWQDRVRAMNKDVEISFNDQAINTKNPRCLRGSVEERRWRMDQEGVRKVP